MMRIKIFITGLFICLNAVLYSQSLRQEFYKAIKTGDTKAQTELSDRLKNTYSSFTYTYYKILLNSLPNKAVLITNALDDTYPIKILQLHQKIRTDVRVVSIKMLKDTAYINTVNKAYKLNIKEGLPIQQINSIFKEEGNSFFSSTVKSTYWYSTSYFISGLYIQKGSQNSRKRLTAFYKDFVELKLKPQQFNGNDRLLVKNVLPPLIALYKNGEPPKHIKRRYFDGGRYCWK